MDVTITEERADSPDAAALVHELTEDMAGPYPPESVHGYSIDKLLARGVSFFVLRVDGEPVGCGGIEAVSVEGYGELKRMYTRPAFRGRGLAARMLDHLEAHACTLGLPLLRLETGIHQHAALALYERHGFRRIGPFGPYQEDPNSVYLEKAVG